MRNFIGLVFVLAPFLLSAQDNGTNMSTYLSPYAGVTFQGVVNTKQTGTAHLRGNFNVFSTDFDLQVIVTGESASTMGYTYGFTYGSVWKKEGRKLNPGFEIDVFQNSSAHESKLSNPNTEVVANVVGPNRDSVLGLVGQYYGAGKHTFSNTMTMNSWNAAVNLTLSYDFSSKISVNGALGAGFTAVTLKNGVSLQSGPAPADPGFEATTDNGGGVVNHFNSQPNASDNLMFGLLRLGTKIELVENVALRIDARGMYMGESTFVFGSTVYTDHAPTDNWTYMIDKGITYAITVGLRVSL